MNTRYLSASLNRYVAEISKSRKFTIVSIRDFSKNFILRQEKDL